MKIKKLICCVLILCLTGCSVPQEKKQSGKIKIVATLFPQYDFARFIAADKADIVLLLSPGVESHSFEPTPSDIIEINECDLFLYTGDEMEPWASSLISSPDFKGISVNVSENIVLVADEHEDEHELDPHIWTNPQMASVMAQNICNALITSDPQNGEFYNHNLEEYKTQLNALDSDFEKAVNDSRIKEMIFGGKFAFHYFTERYALSHMSAFDSCSNETEPSAQVIGSLVDEIRTNDIKAVFYSELESTKVTEAIKTETGVKTLLFHSCHNLTKDEFERGETYLSLMRKNLENLKEGLA